MQLVGFVFFFFAAQQVCRIIASPPGIEPGPP